MILKITFNFILQEMVSDCQEGQIFLSFVLDWNYVIFMNWQLSSLPKSAKILIGLFIISLLLGYVVAILQVQQHIGMTPAAVIREYRGSTDPQDPEDPISFRGLLAVTHKHALAVPMVYFLLSVIFLGTRHSDKIKSLFVSALMGGFLLEYISLWGLRYISAYFVYLAFLSHALSSPSYIYMCLRSLKDLFTPKTDCA